jgi:hypothetical protein
LRMPPAMAPARRSLWTCSPTTFSRFNRAQRKSRQGTDRRKAAARAGWN